VGSPPARYLNQCALHGLELTSESANVSGNVGKFDPEASYLLAIARPYLTLEQADQILTETEGQRGVFLHNGSAFGIYAAAG
jgi:hypothetical protein